MNIKIKKIVGSDASYVPLVLGTLIMIFTVYFVYNQTQAILKNRLQERVRSMVSIAALQLDAGDVVEIIENEPRLAEEIAHTNIGVTEKFDLLKLTRDVQSKSFLKQSSIIKVTKQMKKIREAAPNIRYIYIWRKTDKEGFLAFVTDSDSVYPVDWDNNGKIDELEIPPLPGEEYDITDMPVVESAFEEPLVLNEFLEDRWGTFLSGFAPIKDSQGNTVAIIGMDVEIGDFYNIVRGTLLPFTLQGVSLFILLTILTFSLMKIWKNRVEILKEIDTQKDELLGLVSHQLATPVSSIKWYLEMLEDGDLGDLTNGQKEHVKSMRAIGMNMSDLVSMILDVSRIQLGRMKIEKQELDLNAFFHELVATIEPKAIEKKVKFTKNIPEKLPMAQLDRRYTNMTIENLLSNAVKYTPEGGTVKFEVKLEGNEIFVTVTDTGMGIPKAEQGKIFGRMFRASNARNAIDGNGFGLFVAKGAVEAQGGKIWFESTEGKGTTFSVRLPLKD